MADAGGAAGDAVARRRCQYIIDLGKRAGPRPDRMPGRSGPSSETTIGFSSPISLVEEFDVAAVIRFLPSPGARNITGHDIPVDAGWDV